MTNHSVCLRMREREAEVEIKIKRKIRGNIEKLDLYDIGFPNRKPK